jgi:hypothetical protein
MTAPHGSDDPDEWLNEICECGHSRERHCRDDQRCDFTEEEGAGMCEVCSDCSGAFTRKPNAQG